MDGGVVSHKQWRHQRGQRVIDEEDEEISGKDDKEDDYESTSLSSVSDTSSSDDGGGDAGDANTKMPKKNGGGRRKKASQIIPQRPNIAMKLHLLVLVDIKYQIEMRSYGIHDPQRALFLQHASAATVATVISHTAVRGLKKAKKKVAEELSAQQLDEFKDVFADLEKDGDGSVTTKGFETSIFFR